MRIDAQIILNLETEAVKKQMRRATELGLRDVVVAIHADAVRGSPARTGNNRRSIASEVKGLVGTVFSTSGYGGYLETGTIHMAARPYFKPALDRHLPTLPEKIKKYLA